MLVVLAAAFLIKTSAPEQPWGLDYRAGTVQAAAPILSGYCAQARGNELIVLDLADDLYASALPLARLRYVTVAPVAAADLAALVRAHPESDFLISAAYRNAVESAPQELIGAAADYLLLLSRTSVERTSPPAWSCRM